MILFTNSNFVALRNIIDKLILSLEDKDAKIVEINYISSDDDSTSQNDRQQIQDVEEEKVPENFTGKP